MELFTRLFNIVLVGAIGYWYWKVHKPEAYPFKVSIYNFVFAIGCALVIFSPFAETSKIVSVVFACHFAFMGVVPLITNDYEKYKKDAEPLLILMTVLIAVTGIFVLAMDYPSTKHMFNSLIIGIAIAVVSGWFAHRKSVADKTENL